MHNKVHNDSVKINIVERSIHSDIQYFNVLHDINRELTRSQLLGLVLVEHVYTYRIQ